MKKRILTFLGLAKPEKKKTLEITDAGQGQRLANFMYRLGLHHGDRVRADIHRVQLIQIDHERIHLYFCPLKDVLISERIKKGDGNELPHKVVLKGFEFDKMPIDSNGEMAVLKNVILYSNGSIQVIANEFTVVEKYEPAIHDFQ